MAIRENLVGKCFDRLTVIELAFDESYKKKKWLCQCDCGNKVVVTGSNLKSGHSTQCKACQLSSMQKGNITHDQSHTKLYYVWQGMKNRCENINHKSYADYGRRGIRVCDEWHSFDAFQQWAWSNGYGEGVEIDRINNDGDYCPENCRWVGRLDNARNKSNNKVILYNGEKKTLSEWATHFGVNYKNLSRNLSKGYTLEEAVQRERSGDRTHRIHRKKQ